jgi:hypothetical protein
MHVRRAMCFLAFIRGVREKQKVKDPIKAMKKRKRKQNYTVAIGRRRHYLGPCMNKQQFWAFFFIKGTTSFSPKHVISFNFF